MKRLTLRNRRAVAALAVAIGVTLAAVSPAVAASLSGAASAAANGGTYAGVGAAQPILLESVHAAGKVLQIDDPNAQTSSAPGATQRAAAAIESMRLSDASALRAQALRTYPVDGTTNVYVIADQHDRALARSRNDDAAFRYLTTTDVAAATTDPYAQWEARDAGNGAVTLVNVQRDAAGQPAALDLYNWKTADGSEVQTYTLSTSGAAVQQWRMRSLVPTVATSTVVTAPGAVPAMPTGLTAQYSWGTTWTLPTVTWRMPDPSVWNSDGQVTVAGTSTGFFGEPVDVSVTFAVGAPGDAADSDLRSFAGVTLKELQIRAPRTVTRPIGTTGARITEPVSWNWAAISESSLAAPGTVIVPATATGYAARLVITLVPAQQVNVLRQAGVRYDVLAKDTTPLALTDGNRAAIGFADWRSGGASNRVNPNRVSFTFDQPRQITGVNVYDIGGKQNIGAVTVQYRTLLGGWKNLPSANTWPVANATPNLSLETTSQPVLAVGVRVIVTNKSSATWMTLSEIEAYGPQPTPAS